MAAIVASDILFKYSIGTGSAGNAATSTAAGSLGKYISTSTFAGALNDVFDDISGAENAASTVDYRCIFVHNSNTANVLQNAVVWFTEVAGGASVAIAVDSIAASAIGSSSAQSFGPLANETTPGALLSNIVGGAFSTSATSQGAALSLGNIGIGQCRAIWIRRTAANSAALSSDGMTLNVAGDTGSL